MLADDRSDKKHGAVDSASNHVDEETPPVFDPKAEARLRRKIDLMIIPTVSLLYLFCFIDRANIGAFRLSYSLISGIERTTDL